MKKNEELHSLIKSLNKSERRYFRLFCGNNSDSNVYHRLFEEIDKQEIYNESDIKRIFASEKFVKQLTTAKNYLRNLILKALRNYYADISKNSSLKDTLKNIEILYHKGLYKHAEFEVKKAIKNAQQYENYTALYEAVFWKRRLLQAVRPDADAELKEISLKQLDCTGHLTAYTNAWRSNIGITPDQADSAILEHDALQTRLMKGLHNYQLNIIQNNTPDALQVLKSVVKDMEAHPHRLVEESEMYLSIVNNLIAFFIFMKQYDNAYQYIDQVKTHLSFIKNPGAPIYKILLRTYNIELEIYRDQRDFKKALILIDEINKLLKNPNVQAPITYRISFWFQFANLYFINQNYSEALKWINRLLEYRSDESRPDLIIYAHWLNLMVHYELKNMFVLRYFVDSTKRHLQKRKKIDPFERALLQLFSRVSRVPESESSIHFRIAQKTLAKKGNVIPEEILDYVDFNEWIEKH